MSTHHVSVMLCRILSTVCKGGGGFTHHRLHFRVQMSGRLSSVCRRNKLDIAML